MSLLELINRELASSKGLMPPVTPVIGDDGVPRCSTDDCKYFDGKRCELLGFRPDRMREPAVKAMATILLRYVEESPMMLAKIKQYLDLADEVFQIADSSADAATKYDLIFSKELIQTLEDMFHLEYYDPDTSYEEDVAAFVGALRAKCDELRKIVP